MHFVRLLLCCVLLISLDFLYAQTPPDTVEIKIIDTRDDPVPFATVVVQPLQDSGIGITKVSDSAGRTSFELKAGQLYVIHVSCVNYKPLEKSMALKEPGASIVLMLEPISNTLANVVIATNKPLMRQEDDKTIVDPEAIASTSTNAFEILEKTPGIFVDQDGNVYLNSMSPSKIYINGREMKMSAADIATMLKNLPPNTISRIEILRTPSARYDASGTGGIVNIVLKKGVRIGLTGSAVAGAQQGNYGTQFLSFNLSNNNGRRNTYINLNYSHRNSFENIKTDRLFALDSMLQQNASTKYPASTYFGSYGIADSLSGKWYFDFSGSISFQHFDNYTENKNEIRKISTGEIISNSLNEVRSTGKYFRMNNGISFNYRIDSVSEWINDFYYSHDRNRSSQIYHTDFYSPANFSLGGFGSPDNDRDYFTFTSDLKKKLRQRVTFETGVKASLLKFKSRATYFKETGSGSVKDNGRTNSFNYIENINAVYLQASSTFGKNIILKTGARAENTIMNGDQMIPSDTSFNIRRTDLFPYLYLSKKVMSIAGYELRAYLVYRRTIVRPVYEQLNPFPRYVDQYLSEAGNPSLRPQFTTNYEANISVDERPLLAVGINQTKDIFNQVVYLSDSSNTHSYRTYDNVGKNKEWYLRGLGAIPPGGTYFFVLGAQFNHNFYTGLYEGKPLMFRKGTWTIFTYHLLKLGKRSQLSMNGFVRLKGQQGFYELGRFGVLNSSINRQFLQQKLTVTLSANDILRTNKYAFTINQGSINATGIRQGDTRRFGVNIRYNFGVRKKEESNNMFDVEAPSAN